MRSLCLLSFAVLVPNTAAFLITPPGISRVQGRIKPYFSPCMSSTSSPPPSDGSDDAAPKDSSSDSSRGIDWDGAWQSELEKRSTGTASWRPEGREPVSAQRLAEVRLKRKANEIQGSISTNLTDWRFLLGIIAVISVATAVLGHSSAPDQTSFSV